MRERVPANARRWYVQRAEDFVAAMRPERLSELTVEEITAFFRRYARENQLTDWQFRGTVDALQLLLVELAQAGAAREVDWEHLWESGRALAAAHPTQAAALSPEAAVAEHPVYQCAAARCAAAAATAGPHAVGGALWVADRADLCGLVLPVSAVLWPGERAGGGRRGAGRGRRGARSPRRHLHRAGAARPQGCFHDQDLYAREEPAGGAAGAQTGGWVGVRGSLICVRPQVDDSADSVFLGSGEGRAALERRGLGDDAGETGRKRPMEVGSRDSRSRQGFWAGGWGCRRDQSMGFFARLWSFRAFRGFRRCSLAAVRGSDARLTAVVVDVVTPRARR